MSVPERKGQTAVQLLKQAAQRSQEVAEAARQAAAKVKQASEQGGGNGRK